MASGMSLRDRGFPVQAAALMVVAGIVVGAAIASRDPDLRRVLNGIGGLIWLAGSAVLLWSLRTSPRRLVAGVTALVVVVTLAWFVRPVDLGAALVGFTAGGALLALVGRDRPLSWALLVPAAWLPFHLLTGAFKGLVLNHGRVRTEPPPTAAIVPLSMVLAALAAGLVVQWLLERRSAEVAAA